MHDHQQPAAAPRQIDVLCDQSILFWTSHFGITEQQLRNAVFIEGPAIGNVASYLERHGHVQDKKQKR